jgi:hypothetical protein
VKRNKDFAQQYKDSLCSERNLVAVKMLKDVAGWEAEKAKESPHSMNTHLRQMEQLFDQKEGLFTGR